MAQDFTPPSGTTPIGVGVLTNMLNRDEALRTLHSGPTEPASRVAYMLWADTTSGVIWQRDATNTSWRELLPLAAPVRMPLNLRSLGAMAVEELQVVAPMAGVVERVLLVPDTATTGSVAATTEWTFGLRNVTQAVELFSSTPSTATIVSGVGGGEFAVDTAKVLTPNQNAAVNALDVLRFTIGKVGSPTAVGDVSILLVMTGRGA